MNNFYLSKTEAGWNIKAFFYDFKKFFKVDRAWKKISVRKYFEWRF